MTHTPWQRTVLIISELVLCIFFYIQRFDKNTSLIWWMTGIRIFRAHNPFTSLILFSPDQQLRSLHLDQQLRCISCRFILSFHFNMIQWLRYFSQVCISRVHATLLLTFLICESAKFQWIDTCPLDPIARIISQFWSVGWFLGLSSLQLHWI